MSTLRTGGKFDVPGAIGLAIGLVAILLPITKGSEWGWTSPLTLSLLIGGILLFALWGIYELRTSDPLVDLRVAARRPVLLTNLASITVGFAFFITAASLPILLEAPAATGVGLGQSLMVASLCLMPTGLVMFLISGTAAKLSTARGPRTSLIVGCLVLTVSFLVGATFMTELWHIILLSSLIGLGTGFAYAAMPTLIMHSVPPTETAAANGLNSVMRTLGSTASAAVVGIILSTQVQLHAGIEIPTSDAFRLTFLLGAGVALVGAVIAMFIPHRERGYDDTASIPMQRLGPG